MKKAAPKKKKAVSALAKSYGGDYSTLDFQEGFWRRHWKEAIILLFMAFALYWMTLSYGYVLDDQIVITDNNYTKQGFKGIGKILSTESFEGYFGEQKDLVAGARYRPLSIVTFAIEQELFGNSTALPAIRHFNNILLYGILGLLLFRLFSILVPNRDNQPLWWLAIPFLTAALYILHPIHTEVVANIKGRDEIMTALGAFAALYAALRYLPSRQIRWLVASGILMFLGLMSKENAITFLAIIPLTLYFFSKPTWKDYLLTLVPSIIASVIYLIIRTHVIGYFFDSGKKITDLMNDPFLEMSQPERYATILYTLGIYLKLLIFPHPLTHDYYPYHIPIMNFLKPGTLLSGLVFLTLAFLFIRLFKSKNIYAWCFAFFVATISIVSNIFFPVGTFMNERFAFISSAAFSLATAWTLVQYGWKSDKPLWKWGAAVILLLIVAGYIVKTYTRVPAWKDGLSLNSQAVLVSENSARINCFMATSLYQLARDHQDPNEKKALFEEAEFYADRSLAIYPTYHAANQIKSGLVAERYLRTRDLERLFSDFTALLAARPHLDYLPQFLEYLHGKADASRLTQYYIDTGYEDLSKKRGLHALGLTYLRLGEKLSPQDPRILYSIGKTLYRLGDQHQGNNYMERALAINPALNMD